jgi:hypothetical protein
MDMLPLNPKPIPENAAAIAGGRRTWIAYVRLRLPTMGIVVTTQVDQRLKDIARSIFSPPTHKSTTNEQTRVFVTVEPPGVGKSTVDRFIISLAIEDQQCLLDLNMKTLSKPNENPSTKAISLKHHLTRLALLPGPKFVWVAYCAHYGPQVQENEMVICDEMSLFELDMPDLISFVGQQFSAMKEK